MKAKAMSLGASMLVMVLSFFRLERMRSWGGYFRDSEHDHRPDRRSTCGHQPGSQLDPEDRATGTVARHIDRPDAELYLDD